MNENKYKCRKAAVPLVVWGAIALATALVGGSLALGLNENLKALAEVIKDSDLIIYLVVILIAICSIVKIYLIRKK